MKSIFIKLLMVLIFFLIIFLLQNSVYGADLVDFSQAKVELSYSNNAHLEPKVTISGITFNSNNDYFFQYTNGMQKPTETVPEGYDYGKEWNRLSDDGVDETYICDYLAKAGDIYIWFSEISNETGERHDYQNPIKVERLPQLPIGQRMVACFFDTMADLKIYEVVPHEDLTIKYKIGKITDKSILKDIKDNKPNSMNNLLKYAKEASDTIKTIKASEFESIQLKDLVNKEYYFVYLQLDNAGGKYFNLEDVGLYQASVKNNEQYLLYDTTNPNFVWNFNDNETNKDNNEQKPVNNDKNNINDKEEKKDDNSNKDNNKENNDIKVENSNKSKDETTTSSKLPYTGGMEYLLVAFITLFLISILSFIIYRKWKNIGIN